MFKIFKKMLFQEILTFKEETCVHLVDLRKFHENVMFPFRFGDKRFQTRIWISSFMSRDTCNPL